MKVLEIRVESLNDSFDKFREVFNRALAGETVEKEEYIAVSSVEELNKLLSPKRIQLLNFLKRNKVNSVRELSEKIGRDYKNVYTDLKLFEKLGIIKFEKVNSNLVPKVLYDELDIKVPLKS